MKKRTHEEVEALQKEIFALVQQGLKYKEVADRMELAEDYIWFTMKRYEPFQRMKAEEKKAHEQLLKENKQKVIEMTKAGATIAHIAQTLHMGYKSVRDIRINAGLQKPKTISKQYETVATQGGVRVVITTDDLEVFKKVMQVGDRVRIDLENHKGVIKAKHTHYADVEGKTDEQSYGIPWNWLLACNKEVIGR